jgi:hypothetical protein
MLDFPRWKVWGISLILALGVLFALPSLIPASQLQNLPPWLAAGRVDLGLDLAGGSQLLMEADTSSVAKLRIDQMEESVRLDLRRASPRVEIGDISTAGGRLSFMVRNPAQVDAAVEIARNQTQPVGLGGQRTWDVTVVDSTRVVMTPTPAGLEEALDQAMDTAREIVYNRVDPEGDQGSHCHPPGRAAHPDPGAGAPGPRGAEGAARQDGAARIQAGCTRPVGRGERARRTGHPAPSHAGRWAHRGPPPRDGHGRAAERCGSKASGKTASRSSTSASTGRARSASAG